MEHRLTEHALARMARYGIDERLVRRTLEAPDEVVDGHSGRKIAQKALNGYILRVVFEDDDDVRIVVTVYRARRDRYAL